MDGQRCPHCGRALEAGELRILSGRSSAALSWRSRDKVNYWKRTLFGGKKKVFRRRGFQVLNSRSLWDEEDCAVPAAYCPECRRVFAEIDVRQKTLEEFDE